LAVPPTATRSSERWSDIASTSVSTTATTVAASGATGDGSAQRGTARSAIAADGRP
jgi:hypothetical protein